MRSLFLAGAVLLLMQVGTVRADGAPDEVCDVELDSRMSVYMVTVAGEPYRGKRYLTFDDAVKLRDVLKGAGACDRLAAPRACKVKLLAAGDYAIMRDGVNFDPYAKLRTLKQARRYARSMVRMKLCKNAG
jgi:hypothetical protein